MCKRYLFVILTCCVYLSHFAYDQQKVNLYANFVCPPKGYGEVAFYWWQGDTLKKERLLDQLEMLKGHNVESLQINYAHDDIFDPETGARPHYATVPDVMTSEWWKLVEWFTKEANNRGMTVSLSDYCLGIGQDGNEWHYFYTIVESPKSQKYEVLVDTIMPERLWIDGVEMPISSELYLAEGKHSVVLEYKQAVTTYFMLKDKNKAMRKPNDLETAWLFNDALLQLMPPTFGNGNRGWYRFECAPGTDWIDVQAFTDNLAAYANGEECEIGIMGNTMDNSSLYRVKLPETAIRPMQILLSMTEQAGYEEVAALAAPIKKHVTTGKINVGNWSEYEGLANYSGGGIYAKNIDVDESMLKNRIELDLGEVISTAEVFVNGKSAGVRFAAPWTFDITELLNQGNNKIEILVYNTLGNLYTTIPTAYPHDNTSGILTEQVLNIRKL